MSTEDFFSGHLDDRVLRHKVFANRVSELSHLLSHATASASRRHPVSELRDYRRAAANLRVVHGDGGMGKSALLGRVGEVFLETQPERSRRSVVQIDFSDVGYRDFESVLIRLRSGLSVISKKWPMFDIAFTFYWQNKHPGANILDFLRQSRFLNRGERDQMVDQFAGILDAVLGGTGLINAGYRFASILSDRLTTSAAVRRMRTAYPPFARLMDEEDPDTALAYLATTIAYDIESARGEEQVSVLCTLDTFEIVQNMRPETGNLEDLISRLIYLVPNVAFLVGTRTPLDWASDHRRPTLFYGGPQRWSILTTGGAQMAISGLDVESARGLLTDSLTLDDSPAMPGIVQDKIIRGSYGLPLYLELSINWYRQFLVEKGGEPSQADEIGSFPELVLRLMRDLSSVERDLLRASATLEVFGSEVLNLLVPRARSIEVDRFLDRAFITRSVGSWLPYSLHDVFREAVIKHDHYTDDAWNKTEWTNMAVRATEWLADEALSVWQVEPEGALSVDAGRRCVAALMLSVESSRKHGFVPDRLGDLAFAVRNMGYMRAFESLQVGGDESLFDVERLVAVARVTAARALTSMERYERTLARTRRNPASTIDQFIASELGIHAEVVGRHQIAREAYEFTQSGPAVIAEFGAIGLAYNHLRCGELATALAVTPKRLQHPFFRSSALDLEGHVRLQGGDFDWAAEVFQEALDYGRASGAPLLVARALRHIAMSAMWFDPDRALGVLAEAEQLNSALGEHVGVAQCEMARAMAAAWLGEWERCWTLLRRCQDHPLDPLAIGHPWMVETFLYRVLGDEEGSTRAADIVFSDRRVARTDADRPHVWYAVTALFANRPGVADFNRVEWYDSEPAARGRWLGAVQRMRESSGRQS